MAEKLVTLWREKVCCSLLKSRDSGAMNQQPSASNVHKVNDGQMAEKPAPGARFAAAYCKEENNNVETGRKGCCVTN